jgi:hypothetical protein
MEKRFVNYDAKTGDTIAVEQHGSIGEYTVKETRRDELVLVAVDGDQDETWVVPYPFLKAIGAYYADQTDIYFEVVHLNADGLPSGSFASTRAQSEDEARTIAAGKRVVKNPLATG